jgi:hypothetical protein
MGLSNARDLRLSSSGAPRDTRKLLLLATAVTMALWFLPYSNLLLYPLRLFVTFIHESGHALAAIMAGGSVDSLTVFPNGEGVTWVRVNPIWAWLSLSGGYLGTAVFGAVMLQVGRFTRWRSAGRAALYVVSGFVLLATLLWAHNPVNDLFTLLAGLILSAGLFSLARFSSPQVADFAASFLAVQCGLNALGDLRILLYLTTSSTRDNDAVFMSQHYFLSPVFWAVMWATMAIVILGASLWGYLRATANPPDRVDLNAYPAR